MNSIHPTIAASLSKSLPSAWLGLIANKAPTQPNEPTRIVDKGLYVYQHITFSGLVLDCHLEYSKAEPASHDCPGDPESLELLYALVNGVDVFDVLSDDVVGLIEEEAAQSMAMDKWDSDYDKGEERALDREAA